nr:hypothetical protein 2 [Kangiellaceae bacterium]
MLAFGKSLWGVALRAIPAVITGIRAMSVAFVTTPIGLIIGAIAAGAALIIHYWTPLSAFFAKLFTPVIAVFKNVLGWVNQLWEKAKNIFTSIKKWVSESFIGKTWHVVVGTDDKKTSLSNSSKTVKNQLASNIGHVTQQMKGKQKTVSMGQVIPFPHASNDTYHDNNTTITINAPITIHATDKMSKKDIASAVKHEFNEMIRQAKQRKMACNYD